MFYNYVFQSDLVKEEDSGVHTLHLVCDLCKCVSMMLLPIN